MLSNRLTFAALGVACMTAAGVGGYLATRQGATGTTAVGASSEPLAQEAPLSAAVQETEEPLTPAPVEPEPARRPNPSNNRVSPVKPPATAPESRRPELPAASRSSVPVPPATPAPVEAVSPTAATTASSPVIETPVAAVPPRVEEPVSAPDPPIRNFEELVVSADSVIGLQIETALSSEQARVEDRVEARVTRDVKVGGTVAVPAGARAIGSVTAVERGGRMKDRARLGIRFHTLVLADGTRVPISTDAIYRTGDAPGNTSAAKIGGGAAAGAILGAIIGGAKGAAIGGSIGAGAGTASVMTSERSAATFPAGTEVNARILSPVTVSIERQ